jgi:predicted Mrr-cat superfamily restriction endonuclease
VPKAWLIRAGEGASALDEMRVAGVIAVRYPQIQTDARTVPSAQIEQLIEESGRTQPGVRRVRLEWFVHEVAIGDLVVTPDARRGNVWLATVTSDYMYSPTPPVAGYFHWRWVTWLGAIDRDHLPAARRTEVSRRPTIVRDLDYDWWKATTGSAVGVAGSTRRDALSLRDRTVAHKPAPVAAFVVCRHPGCGLSYPAPSMVEGLCPDHRAS